MRLFSVPQEWESEALQLPVLLLSFTPHHQLRRLVPCREKWLKRLLQLRIPHQPENYEELLEKLGKSLAAYPFPENGFKIWDSLRFRCHHLSEADFQIGRLQLFPAQELTAPDRLAETNATIPGRGFMVQ